jgi:CHRD domain
LETRSIGTAILAAGFVLAAITAGRAETVTLAAHLLGGSAVPANASDAFADAEFGYDSQTRQLDYYVNYDGIAPTKVDLHGPAGNGDTAQSVLPFPLSGSPLNGRLILSADQAEMLLSGRMYLDIHSAAHPEGEIRGEVVKE